MRALLLAAAVALYPRLEYVPRLEVFYSLSGHNLTCSSYCTAHTMTWMVEDARGNAYEVERYSHIVFFQDLAYRENYDADVASNEACHEMEYHTNDFLACEDLTAQAVNYCYPAKTPYVDELYPWMTPNQP